MTYSLEEYNCPLCKLAKGTLFHQEKRNYYRCPNCEFVFVPQHQFLSSSEEKAVYDQHENSPDDQRYREFLSRLMIPMQELLPPNSNGLDFGSGPGPTLSVMFEELGHQMEIYDPFYAPENNYSAKHYDFISTSEVVEHLHEPREELDRLWACLNPNGILGIMTKRVVPESFATWHYIRDPTHVSFFSLNTFQWLAKHWQAELMVPGSDVVIFRKNV